MNKFLIKIIKEEIEKYLDEAKRTLHLDDRVNQRIDGIISVLSKGLKLTPEDKEIAIPQIKNKLKQFIKSSEGIKKEPHLTKIIKSDDIRIKKDNKIDVVDIVSRYVDKGKEKKDQGSRFVIIVRDDKLVTVYITNASDSKLIDDTFRHNNSVDKNSIKVVPLKTDLLVNLDKEKDLQKLIDKDNQEKERLEKEKLDQASGNEIYRIDPELIGDRKGLQLVHPYMGRGANLDKPKVIVTIKDGSIDKAYKVSNVAFKYKSGRIKNGLTNDEVRGLRTEKTPHAFKPIDDKFYQVVVMSKPNQKEVLNYLNDMFKRSVMKKTSKDKQGDFNKWLTKIGYKPTDYPT